MADAWGGAWGDAWGTAWGAVVVVEDVDEAESGGTTLSARERQQRWGDERRRKLLAQARADAEETARLAKADAKRKAKRAYRAVYSRTETTDAIPLEDVVAKYAPNLADTLGLPPEEAVKFDLFVQDQAALRVLYIAYYEAIEIEMQHEEDEAIAVLMLM